MPRRTATLEDVARAAGVSQQTVSRVLNRPEVVSARTREQVIRAMQALHYVPNRSAQLLAGKAAPSIGLITASLTLHARITFSRVRSDTTPGLFSTRETVC